MKAILLALLTLLMATACSLQQPNFESMSEQELFEYNASVGVLDQVYCRDDVRTGSHLRKRYCTSYGDALGGNIGTLATPSSSSSITYSY